jgi:hypothetical protein
MPSKKKKYNARFPPVSFFPAANRVALLFMKLQFAVQSEQHMLFS